MFGGSKISSHEYQRYLLTPFGCFQKVERAVCVAGVLWQSRLVAPMLRLLHLPLRHRASHHSRRMSRWSKLCSGFVFNWFRIRHFRLNTNPDPGFWWPNIWKNLQLQKNFIFFWSKIALYLSLGFHKGLPSYRWSFYLSPQTSTSSTYFHGSDTLKVTNK